MDATLHSDTAYSLACVAAALNHLLGVCGCLSVWTPLLFSSVPEPL